MHPAPSLILFTTLSGAGFGLLAFLGLGMPDVAGGSALAFFIIAYGVAVGGLSASVFHLKRPSRAWRAFTQVRSSWLSREAWAASATLLILAPYALSLILGPGRIAWLGWIGAAGAALTLVATGMIYAQIRAVPRWHDPSTPVLFLAHGAAAGALLSGQVTAAVVLLLALGVAQIVAWARGDGRFGQETTLATATGLTRGQVRSFERPHTGESYLTREMVFVVARRHARRLRAIGIGLAVVVPIVALLLPFSHLWAAVAAMSHLAGTGVLRWLFYAEAEHVVGLYYGRRADAA